jgi:hypothetical protein
VGGGGGCWGGRGGLHARARARRGGGRGRAARVADALPVLVLYEPLRARALLETLVVRVVLASLHSTDAVAGGSAADVLFRPLTHDLALLRLYTQLIVMPRIVHCRTYVSIASQ